MKYASPDVQVFFGAGSPLTDITAWCTGPIPMGGQGIYVDATPYGATAVVNQPVGMTDDADVVIEGLFDSATPGPHDVFKTISGASTAAYTLQVVYGLGSPAGATATRLVHIGSYEVLSEVKNVVKFRATLKAAGGTTWT
jgi:hypothetical protein